MDMGGEDAHSEITIQYLHSHPVRLLLVFDHHLCQPENPVHSARATVESYTPSSDIFLLATLSLLLLADTDGKSDPGETDIIFC